MGSSSRQCRAWFAQRFTRDRHASECAILPECAAWYAPTVRMLACVPGSSHPWFARSVRNPHGANLGASHNRLASDLYPSVLGNFLPNKTFG
ncbi:hypothetical protein PAGU2196_39760 [Pseudomonas sp. PAGU 2196]|nr:hypothetical protein PAGU2196_39760 [Pseudomonas sp. PAGU 2196]